MDPLTIGAIVFALFLVVSIVLNGAISLLKFAVFVALFIWVAPKILEVLR